MEVEPHPSGDAPVTSDPHNDGDELWQPYTLEREGDAPETPQFEAKYVGTRLHILCSSELCFRTAQRELLDSKLSFHTFSLKEEQELKTVVRGLPAWTATEDIENELRDLGCTPTHVAPLQRRIQAGGHQTNNFYIRFRITGSWTRIWQLTQLLGVRVTHAASGVEEAMRSNPARYQKNSAANAQTAEATTLLATGAARRTSALWAPQRQQRGPTSRPTPEKTQTRPANYVSGRRYTDVLASPLLRPDTPAPQNRETIAPESQVEPSNPAAKSVIGTNPPKFFCTWLWPKLPIHRGGGIEVGPADVNRQPTRKTLKTRSLTKQKSGNGKPACTCSATTANSLSMAPAILEGQLSVLGVVGLTRPESMGSPRDREREQEEATSTEESREQDDWVEDMGRSRQNPGISPEDRPATEECGRAAQVSADHPPSGRPRPASSKATVAPDYKRRASNRIISRPPNP
ncbi:hypothetical protein J6590_038344 [Homalodisca vitripennis]|nr:hypothetical protein J6590_038344 [Homalodisca vitripennis]